MFWVRIWTSHCRKKYVVFDFPDMLFIPLSGDRSRLNHSWQSGLCSVHQYADGSNGLLAGDTTKHAYTGDCCEPENSCIDCHWLSLIDWPSFTHDSQSFSCVYSLASLDQKTSFEASSHYSKVNKCLGWRALRGQSRNSSKEAKK